MAEMAGRWVIVRPFQLIGKGITARLAPGAFAEQDVLGQRDQDLLPVGVTQRGQKAAELGCFAL